MSLIGFSEIQSKQYPRSIIRCPFDNCKTRIILLNETLAQRRREIANAPAMAQESRNFFELDDVWDFDNIGVSKAAPQLQSSLKVGEIEKVERLLICSECDKGPLGFAGFRNPEDTDVKKLCYYLSCESVAYEEIRT
uniref:Mss4-like protein n=1 Tax=Candidozyma auris TaxID=498019 RepID=A0A0L0P0M5_CANAR